jgi:hypothetical protein
MISISSDQFEVLLPLTCEWAEAKEKVVLKHGVPLSEAQMNDAKRVGIVHTERIRIYAVSQIPMPKHPVLKAVAEATNLISPNTAGITFRYGIFILSGYSDDRSLVVHELVHTSQYEKLGGFLPFLQKYLKECITIGYPGAPMEKEAIRITEEICRR